MGPATRPPQKPVRPTADHPWRSSYKRPSARARSSPLVLCLTFTLTIPKLGHCPLTRPSATLSPDGGEGAKLTIYSASPPARVGVRGSPAQLESYFRCATLAVGLNYNPRGSWDVIQAKVAGWK